MALVICHSPKGGVGTTFLAAHLAMGLSELEQGNGMGGDVSLLTLSTHDLTPLHFGLAPATRLPSLWAPAEAAVLVSGIDLRCDAVATADSDFLDRLDDAGYLDAGSDRTLVIDVPAGARALARRLVPHATVHVCPLMASPDCLALLPQALEDAESWGARRTAFVLGKLDETRKLARHVAAFTREVLGERLVGKIRHDESVPEALAMLQLLGRYAPASAALADARQLAQAIGALLAAERPNEAESDETMILPATKPGASRAA